MNVELYEHQQLAIQQLSSGKILCAGVGTGKSRTALAFYFAKIGGGELQINGDGEFKPMKNDVPLYVITTARKRDSNEWKEEAIPFLLYDKIHVDSWNNITKYTEVSGAFFIFDEQRLVGSGAWVRAFYKIARKNRWILLSATPGDTWLDYIPVFVANGFYKNKTEFYKRHVILSPYTTYPKVQRYMEVSRLIRLKEMILVEMEYTKPVEEHHEYVICEYNKEKYFKVFDDRWDIYKNRPIKNISGVFSLIRRVCNSDPSRIEAVKRILCDHPKVIVFYNFDYELDILRDIAKKMGIEKAELNGHAHDPIPTTSQWVYLVQYAAGAEAWNCVETNAMIFYSLSYSWKATEQAAGRISRMNTPYSDLYYYHLTSKSPIDKAIEKCLRDKKSFNEKRYSKKIGYTIEDNSIIDI